MATLCHFLANCFFQLCLNPLISPNITLINDFFIICWWLLWHSAVTWWWCQWSHAHWGESHVNSDLLIHVTWPDMYPIKNHIQNGWCFTKWLWLRIGLQIIDSGLSIIYKQLPSLWLICNIAVKSRTFDRMQLCLLEIFRWTTSLFSSDLLISGCEDKHRQKKAL